MTVRIGLIVEGESDKDVVELLLRKLAKRALSCKAFVARGSGKLVAKCAAWTSDLHKRGCAAVVVVHDRDDNDANQLRALLEDRLAAIPARAKVVVIPVRELEAWLIADPGAIEKSFRMNAAVSATASPELHPDPKRRLYELIYAASHRRIEYVASVHNARIARNADPATIAKQCPSFAPLASFAAAHLA